MSHRLIVRCSAVLLGVVFPCFQIAKSEQSDEATGVQANLQVASSRQKQHDLEDAFKKMLSGATLEGSFTSTGKGLDSTKLTREKYTLGEVEKVPGDFWRIPARIEYGEKDFTIPLILPVRWAGDTPIIVVDEVGLPGFGKVSARVMFFADHYAGYWKHGEHGGHLFGTISRDEQKPATPIETPTQAP